MMSRRIHFKPKIDKIVETILYLSHKIASLDAYRVVKLVYLSDREHLNRYGRPITFDRMVAMKAGPVASCTYNILKGQKVVDGVRIGPLPFELKNIDPYTYVVNPSRSVNKILFSKSDLKILDEMVAKYGHADPQELYNETHNHFAYRKAWESRGNKKASPMLFEDILEESVFKEDVVSDLETISAHI
jgi:uncharacterized phage-associated protein